MRASTALASILLAASACGEAHAPPAPASAPKPLRYTGLNLGAGGFVAKRVPARYGFDYAYPDAEEAAPFLAAGMNAVRVPVLWKRLQPAPLAALDEVEMRRVDASLTQMKRFELVIIDVHDYGRYRGKAIDDAAGAAMLADLWTRLASRYGRDRRIAFGLMNEPHGIDARAWRGVVDQVVAAIRRTGARNLLLIPGTRWTGAASWTQGGAGSNAAAFAGFRDSGGPFAYELHLYPDADSSGTHTDCVPPERAAARLDAVTAWLRAEGARGFLGEFGAAANPGCLAALDAMLRRLEDAPEAWLGWTYWAGGAWWGRYPFSIQPDGNGHKPQMRILKSHLRRVSR